MGRSSGSIVGPHRGKNKRRGPCSAIPRLSSGRRLCPLRERPLTPVGFKIVLGEKSSQGGPESSDKGRSLSDLCVSVCGAVFVSASATIPTYTTGTHHARTRQAWLSVCLSGTFCRLLSSFGFLPVTTHDFRLSSWFNVPSFLDAVVISRAVYFFLAVEGF